MSLTIDEKKKLLKLARETVELYVTKGEKPVVKFTEPGLNQRSGAFVTLNKHGQLRGCIGVFTSDKPLYETVIDMAVAAATQDPRFPPVTPDEVPELEIEISVLSPLRPVKSIDEIEVGKHGIFVTKGFYRGVLLPQVATEYGWDRETFLSQTCIKAGLPPDAWRYGDVTIEIFSADVFSEGMFE